MARRIGDFATIQDEHVRLPLRHRKDRDYWNQPGGSRDPGEAPWEDVLDLPYRVSCATQASVLDWAAA